MKKVTRINVTIDSMALALIDAEVERRKAAGEKCSRSAILTRGALRYVRESLPKLQADAGDLDDR